MRIVIEAVVFVLAAVIVFMPLLFYNEYGTTNSLDEFYVILYPLMVFVMFCIYTMLKNRGKISGKRLVKTALFNSLIMLVAGVWLSLNYYWHETYEVHLPVNGMYEADIGNKVIDGAVGSVAENQYYPDPGKLHSSGGVDFFKERYIYFVCNGCRYEGYPADEIGESCESMIPRISKVDGRNEVFIYAFALKTFYRYENLAWESIDWDKKLKSNKETVR